MTKTHMMFGVLVFIFMGSFVFLTAKESGQKDFVFKRQMHTKINGNSVFSYIYLKREQSNPSYVFKHTRIVECSKDKKLQEVGTLGSFQKAYKLASYGEKTEVDRFEKFANMNNAIYCAGLEQKLNYYDELEDVGAIIYGTQDVEDCALFKEYLAQQEVVKNKVVQK